MSYDKNTRIMSSLDAIKETLNLLEHPYQLEILGEVGARGLSDDFNGIDKYPIRKLSCNKFVILEQMQRTEDCDEDDYLVSFTFLKGAEPTEWPLEIEEFNDIIDYRKDVSGMKS